MFSKIAQYWDLIGEYTNPFKIIWSGVSYALIAFFILLILMIVLRKLILVKRQHAILTYLSYSYFILVPILVTFFAFKLGIVSGLQKDLTQHLPKYTENINKELKATLNDTSFTFFKGTKTGISNSLFHDLKNNFNVDLSPNQTIDVLSGIIGVTAFETVNRTDNKAVSFFISTFLAASSDILLKKEVEKFAESVGIEKNITKEIMNKKITDMLDKGLLDSIFEVQINKLFNGFKNSIYFILFILLLIPSIEIFIAHKYKTKTLNINPNDQPHTNSLSN